MNRAAFNLFLIVRYFVSFVFGLFSILLFLRLFLRLFAANPDTGFVQWIYQTTSPLVSPFAGIFPNPSLENGYVLEASTLFALIIYAIIYFAIVELIEFFARLASDRTTRTVVIKD